VETGNHTLRSGRILVCSPSSLKLELIISYSTTRTPTTLCREANSENVRSKSKERALDSKGGRGSQEVSLTLFSPIETD